VTATVFLGLGANLGNRQHNLIMALDRLAPLALVDLVSSLYETEPAGPVEQPLFLNAVCSVITGLRPMALLRHIQEVEREIGRRRGKRWGPRVIDIDLLLYEDSIVDEPGLRVPHSELARRPFVLVPLAEIAPDIAHPESGDTISGLAANVDCAGVSLVAQPGWQRPA
jgi:2-amino-4-hydroxy-6-hydroxymethyldihydropteridine diphosphokinase